MAGTLLLIPKRNTSDEKISETYNQIINRLSDDYLSFFNNIYFNKLNDGSLLIRFRHDTKNKFFECAAGWLTYEGTVFALNETKTLSAEELWTRYKSHGTSMADQLDGHFVVKIYDKITDTYLVINDFIKNKTNFVCETDDFILFTPFAVISGAIKKPELDRFAYNEFMWRYYIMSFRSMLRSVDKLKPASIYTVKDGVCNRAVYWDCPHEFTEMPFKAAVDRTVDSMQETARLIGQTFGPPVLDFTLGQDTRQNVSAFTSAKVPFVTSTYGKDDFEEVIKVRAMAERHGIKHYNIQLENDYTDHIWSHFHKSVVLGSCEEPGHLLGRIMYMRSQQSKYGTAIINGVEGQFYKNGLWDELYTFNLYREPKEFNIDTFMNLRALSKNYPDNFYSDDYLTIKQNSKEYVRNIAKDSIKNHLDAPVSMQVDRFDIYHWLNYGTTSNNGCNLISNSFSTLLLRRNLEFALQIPVQWKFNLSKYQRALVYSMDPALAREKCDWANTNMVPKNALTYIPFIAKYFYAQSKRLRKKMLTRMGFNMKTALQKAWDYRPLFEDLASKDKFKDLLVHGEMHMNDIIESSKWNNYIDQFANPNERNLGELEQLFKLASAELLIREAAKFGLENLIKQA